MATSASTNHQKWKYYKNNNTKLKAAGADFGTVVFSFLEYVTTLPVFCRYAR